MPTRRSIASHIAVAAAALAIAGAATAGATGLISGSQIKAGTITPRNLSKSLRAQIAKAGTPGPRGPAGSQGLPGPVTNNAPSGLTQRGVFEISGYETQSNDLGTSVSFPLQLASAPTVVIVPFGGSDPHCLGTPGAPAAAAGYLCLYIRTSLNVTTSQSGIYYVYPQEPDQLAYGAAPFGVILTARAASLGWAVVGGSWAVTAP